jgi:hypothetical protein
MSGESFQTLDVTRAGRALRRLHTQVSGAKGRVEIKRRGCDDVCVIISKTELDALEQALEILSDTADFKNMCANITQLAAHCDGYAAAQA